MKRVWLLGIIGSVALACSGKVVDSGTGAGTDRSSAEVLADEQENLCTSICGMVATCDLNDGSSGASEADCIDDCGEIIAGAIESGETCADATLQAMRCYDGLGCAELAAEDNACEASMEAAMRCGGGASSEELPSEGSCWGGGAAAADGHAIPVGTVVCEEGCNGSPARQVSCVQGTQDITCTCLLDGVAQSQFLIAECLGDLMRHCGF